MRYPTLGEQGFYFYSTALSAGRVSSSDLSFCVTSGPSRMAFDRVCGFASRALMSTIVSGTARKTPTVPRTQPQKSNERNTAGVEIACQHP